MGNIEVKIVGKPDKLFEKVFEKVVEEAVDKKVEEALKAALQLLTTARDQALASIEKEVEEILRIAEERLRAYESSLEARLRVEIARLKTSYANKAVEEALKRFRDIVPEDKYRETLRRMLRDALQSIAVYTRDVIIVPATKDVNLIQSILPEVEREVAGLSVEVSSKTIDSIGGFIMQSRDGRVSLDYRLEAVLSRALDRARARAMKELFG